MEVITLKVSILKKLKEILRFRSLIYFLALRNIKVKYRQTLIGILWTILQPLLIMLIFVFFFSKTLSVSTDEIPAPLFYLFGLVLWNYFSSAVTNASSSIVQNGEMIKRIYFPRIILPLSSALMALFDFIINAILLFLICIIYMVIFNFEVSFLHLFLHISLGLAIICLAAIGIGVAISSLSVFYRDFLFIIPFALQFLFFTSPIIYPSSAIQEPILSNLMALNPLVGAIELGRSSLSESTSYIQIYISLFSAILILGMGCFIYFRTEKHFADVL